MPQTFETTDFGCGGIALDGATRDCSSNPGGVLRVGVSPAGVIKSVTVGDEGIVTAITSVDEENTAPFAEFFVNKKASTATFTTTFTPSETSIGGTYQNDLVFQIEKMGATTRQEFMSLMSADCLVLFQQRADRRWFLLGVPGDAAEASAGDGTTGAAIADYNGYNVTLSTTSDLTPFEVDPDVAEALMKAAA